MFAINATENDLIAIAHTHLIDSRILSNCRSNTATVTMTLTQQLLPLEKRIFNEIFSITYICSNKRIIKEFIRLII